MLLEEVKRHDPDGRVKRVSIEALRASGKPLPPALHSVPGLLTLPQKNWLFGKAVFDYLLLPGRGKLLGGSGGDRDAPPPPGPKSPGGVGPAGEPAAFGFGSGLSDSFAGIADDSHTLDNGLADRAYMWAAIHDMPAQHPVAAATLAASGGALPPAVAPTETRARKGLPSLEEVRRLREEAI